MLYNAAHKGFFSLVLLFFLSHLLQRDLIAFFSTFDILMLPRSGPEHNIGTVLNFCE